MSRIFYLTFSFAILFTFSTDAQIIEGAKRAVKKAEQKVAERAVEKTFNGLVEKLFGKDTSSVKTTETIDSSDSSGSSILSGLFKSKPVDKNFEFDLALEMEITTKEEGKEANVINTTMLYPKNSAVVGTEMESVLNIMDFEEMMNYSIVGGKVTVMDLQSIIDKAEKMSKEEDSAEERTPPELIKTGKKEVVAGFECEEYEMKDENVNGLYYMTQEIGVSAEAFANAFSTNPNVTVPSGTQGIMLKMIMTDLESKITTSMITKSVKKENRSYDLSKYKATDLSRLKF